MELSYVSKVKTNQKDHICLGILPVFDAGIVKKHMASGVVNHIRANMQRTEGVKTLNSWKQSKEVQDWHAELAQDLKEQVAKPVAIVE